MLFVVKSYKAKKKKRKRKGKSATMVQTIF